MAPMRHPHPLGPLLASIGIALAATSGAGLGAAKEDTRITVILSQDAQPYQEALAGFRRYLEEQGVGAKIDVQALHGEGTGAGAALQRARQDRASLVLALGSIGAQAAARDVRDVPIVAGLILNADDLGNAPNVSAVVLEFPVETELRFLQRLLPGQRNVGVLFNPPENQARIDRASHAAADLGLNLIARQVRSPMELPDALESMNRRADVLWGVPDQIVLNSQTARPILLFSLRNRIPFVGLSDMWVKAGALYALDRDYADIGAQCGEAALKILRGAAPSSLPTAPPRKVVYSVNLKTARLLKVGIKASVLQSAQTVIE